MGRTDAGGAGEWRVWLLLASGGKTWSAVFFSAVGFFAVADLDDEDDELLVLNRIDDPVITSRIR